MRLELRDMENNPWAVITVSHAEPYTDELVEMIARRLKGVWVDDTAVIDTIAVYDNDGKFIETYDGDLK